MVNELWHSAFYDRVTAMLRTYGDNDGDKVLCKEAK